VVPSVGILTVARRTTTALAVLVAATLWQACAESYRSPRARVIATPSLRDPSSVCSTTVLGALRDVAMYVYREGAAPSEMTATAQHFIVTSIPLRKAVEHDDPGAARIAAEAVLATGFFTNLRVSRGSRMLADVGGPDSLAPIHGTLVGASGAPIASFLTSVWSDHGFLAQTESITEGIVALRMGGRSIAGSFALPPGELPTDGTITRNGVEYQYTSFSGESYPAGRLRVYLLMPVASTAHFCGRTAQDTVVNAISHVAALIYTDETGPRALAQVHRVQRNMALLQAVARRDPAATRRAIVGLLNQHVVRLSVSADGHVVADVGGPFVLAPRNAALRLGGHTIGTVVLSIQDDLGYLLLAHRLARLDVVMRIRNKLVMSSLGPAPPPAPSEGSYRYRGRAYRVFTLNATAFPSGPLRITVLIPIPYS
jgi:hypothetical protein